MALSRRVDLTEQGDFLNHTLRLGQVLSGDTFPFSTAIHTLYRNRDRRIIDEQQRRQIKRTEVIEFRERAHFTSWTSSHRTFTSSSELTVGDLVTMLSKPFGFPWTTTERGYADSNLRNEDSIGRPKLILTGNRSDILNHKRWQAHRDGYECECCGKDFTRMPWQGYQNLCTVCHDRMGFNRLNESTPYPFERIIEDLMQRRSANSFRFSANHSLWVDSGTLSWDIQEEDNF